MIPIAFFVYKVPGFLSRQKPSFFLILTFHFYTLQTDSLYEKLGAEYFLCMAEEGRSGDFIDSREVILRTNLEPGYYVIVPATFNPDSETNFMLRVFALRPFTLTEIIGNDNNSLSDEDNNNSISRTDRYI